MSPYACTDNGPMWIVPLDGLGIDGKALLVDSLENHNLSLASRNVASLKTVDALAVNVYDVVDRPFLVLSAARLREARALLAARGNGDGS